MFKLFLLRITFCLYQFCHHNFSFWLRFQTRSFGNMADGFLQASMRVGATDRIVRNVNECTSHASCAASTCTHLVNCIYIALSHYNWMSPLQNSLLLQSFLRKSTYSYFLRRRNLKPQESLHIYTAVLLDSILLKAQITIPSSSTKVTRVLFTLYVEHM